MSISSMTAVSAPQERTSVNFMEPHPGTSHWTRTCNHETVARLKRYPSGVKARMQCKKCGLGVGQLISTVGVMEMWDDDLERRCAQSFSDACDEWSRKRIAWVEQNRADKSVEWWAAYERYLQSPVWRKKRAMVLERNKRLHRGLCESCGENQPTDVHHTSYPTSSGLPFGHEPLWCLQAVCRRCHEIFHPHMRKQ